MHMEDLGALMQFWLQVRYEEEGFSTAKLAADLGVGSKYINAWLRGDKTIPDKYWRGIAAHFTFPRHTAHAIDDLFTEARRLWTVPENRRLYLSPTATVEPKPPRTTPNSTPQTSRRRRQRRARRAVGGAA